VEPYYVAFNNTGDNHRATSYRTLIVPRDGRGRERPARVELFKVLPLPLS